MSKRSEAEARANARRAHRAASKDALNPHRESGSGGDFMVRRVSGAAATKTYRCPGCDHEIRPGTPHVVAWPEWDLDDRRHWHTPCWRSRARRSPTVQRSSRAPRY